MLRIVILSFDLVSWHNWSSRGPPRQQGRAEGAEAGTGPGAEAELGGTSGGAGEEEAPTRQRSPPGVQGHQVGPGDCLS